MSKLRYAILVNGSELYEWQKKTIEILEAQGLTELIVVIEKNEPQSSKERISSKARKALFFKLYNKFMVKPKSHSLVKSSINSIANTFKHFKVKIHKKGKYTEYFAENDIATLKSLELDFIIRFGFGIIRGDILNVSKYGVWSFHHDDPEVIRGGPPCFWEMYLNLPCTGAILQRLTDTLDGGDILYKGFFQTHKYSYRKNLDQVYLESTNWPALVVKSIHIERGLKVHDAQAMPNKIYKAPNALQVSIFIAKSIFKYGLHIVSRLFFTDQWSVATSRCEIDEVIFQKKIPRAKFNWFPKLKHGIFVADPFLHETENGVSCFVEHCKYGEKGKICEYKDIEQKTYNSKVIMSDFSHYSYPLIYLKDKEVYCLPENFETNKLGLYRKCQDKWIYVKPLINGKAVVDATIVSYNDRYWIFCTIKDRNPNLNLFIFSANELDGSYEPHPLNPVKTDVRSSRPAGNFVTVENKLYRPAQNCSRTYGGSIIFNEVKELTETSFEEESVFEITPMDKYPDGIHTISHSKNFIAIDGKKISFSPFAWYFRMKNKLNHRGTNVRSE